MVGKLRIIAGQWRGRRLPVADRPDLRPTGDRTRETLFNWLQGHVRGRSALDLFAGSGALGIEAASRGANRVVLVERDRMLAESLRSLLAGWPDSDAISVVHDDALAFLARASAPFDLVFVDPPFDARVHARVLDALARPGYLTRDSRVYLESPVADPAPVLEDDPQWRILKYKRQGEVRLQLVERAELADPADTAPLPPIPGA